MLGLGRWWSNVEQLAGEREVVGLHATRQQTVKERRRASVIARPLDAPAFPGLHAVGRIEVERRANGKLATKAHYVVLSKRLTPPGAPSLDFVFTVCDSAAAETCPVWPGQPMTAHWSIPDPAAAKGTAAEIALAFKDAYRMLHHRIGAFTALPLRSLDQLSLQAKLKEIGHLSNATTKAAEST
jgi:hypothetical protein